MNIELNKNDRTWSLFGTLAKSSFFPSKITSREKLTNELKEVAAKSIAQIQEAFSSNKKEKIPDLDLVINQLTKGHAQRVKLINWLKAENPANFTIRDKEVLNHLKGEIEKKMKRQPTFSYNRTEELQEINKLLNVHIQKSTHNAKALEEQTNLIANSFSDDDLKLEGFSRISPNKEQLNFAAAKFLQPGIDRKKILEEVADPFVRLGILQQLWKNPPDEMVQILSKPELTSEDIHKLGPDFNALIKLVKRINSFSDENKMTVSNLAIVFGGAFVKDVNNLSNITNNMEKLISN